MYTKSEIKYQLWALFDFSISSLMVYHFVKTGLPASMAVAVFAFGGGLASLAYFLKAKN